MSFIRHFVSGMLLGTLFMLTLLPAAHAHDPVVFFDPVSWDNYKDVDYKIDDSIPGSNGSPFEMRIHDAAGAWNAIGGVDSFDFDDNGNDSTNFWDPCNWEDATSVDIRVFYRNIGSTGEFQRCVTWEPQRGVWQLESGAISFDDGFTWHTGAADDPPGVEVSAEEVALHEFGHATGTFTGGAYNGHWNPSNTDKCPLNDSMWTMCPTGLFGQSIWLPLESHDIDTFQAYY